MKTPTLEPPSEATLETATEASSSRFQVSKFDEEKLNKLRNESGVAPSENPEKEKA